MTALDPLTLWRIKVAWGLASFILANVAWSLLLGPGAWHWLLVPPTWAVLAYGPRWLYGRALQRRAVQYAARWQR